MLIDAAHDESELDALVERRTAGLPIEHIVGWAEFAGLRVAVEAGVFVPRRRSEHLLAQAASFLIGGEAVIDVCCGAGALGMALLTALPSLELYAVDVEPAAVECALRNLAPLGGHVYTGDLFAPLPSDLRGRVAVVVANAPYVPSDEVDLLPREARLHEPRITLDGGVDGLAIQRRIIAAAPHWLQRGGALLIETGEHQASVTADVFREHGFSVRISWSDDLAATVVVGLLSGSSTG